MRVRLLTCVGVADDLPLLPHWLDHYAGLGIAPADTICLLNATDAKAPNLLRAEALLAERGAVAVRWIAPYTSETMWAARRALQEEHAGPDDWVLSADVDEFHVYPAPLGEVLAACRAGGITCLQGPFVDRLGPDGVLAAVSPDRPLAEQFPVAAEASLSLFGEGRTHNRYGTVKIMAMRGGVMPDRGGHHPQDEWAHRYLYGAPLAAFGGITTPRFRFAVPTQVHHYHWTAALPARLERRLATPGVSAAGAEYGARQLAALASGRVPLETVALRPEGEAGTGDWKARAAALRRRAPLIRARHAAGRAVRRGLRAARLDR